MSNTRDSADLILRLYELRREPVLRDARAWYIKEFHPKTFDEVMEVVSGEKSPWFRMVVSYWDMACSLVMFGAIEEDMFYASNGELLTVFAKLEPFLEQMQQSNPELLNHLAHIARKFPNAETYLPQIRERSGMKPTVEGET